MIPANQIITESGIERVILDVRAGDAVLEEAERLDAGRVALVSTRSLLDTDDLRRIATQLGDRFVGMLPPIRAHAPLSDLAAVTSKALDIGAGLIVGIGGSSVLDGVKVVALARAHRATTADAIGALSIQYDAQGRITARPDRGPDIPIVCVPTTLSGGEFNTLSGGLDEAAGRKLGFQHPGMVPRAVVLDPDITRHTPDRLWFASGIRAVDHAVETLVSPHSNPFYDGLAESGLRLLAEALPRGRDDPADHRTRHLAQIGAWQTVIPLVAGVPMGASHAIGHALGAFGIPHGETSCVMAAAVQRWNSEVPVTAQRRAAAALGDPDAPLGDLLASLIRGLGLPASLADIGIGSDRYDRLAELTLADLWGGTNVRPLTGPDDVKSILRMAEH